MSASAVRLIQSGIACSDEGAINRLSVITQASPHNEGVLDLARKLEPLFAPPRAQVTERANRLLARPLRGQDGLHQHIVGVGLALVEPTRFADIHVAL